MLLLTGCTTGLVNGEFVKYEEQNIAITNKCVKKVDDDFTTDTIYSTEDCYNINFVTQADDEFLEYNKTKNKYELVVIITEESFVSDLKKATYTINDKKHILEFKTAEKYALKNSKVQAACMTGTGCFYVGEYRAEMPKSTLKAIAEPYMDGSLDNTFTYKTLNSNKEVVSKKMHKAEITSFYNKTK
jgi:hypothetical protein